jgi:hypothetical protein
MRALSLSRSVPLGVLAALVAAFATGCSTYQDDLARSQRAFEHADYERALAIFRSLEPEEHQRFSIQEQATYCYLRGMTDYRVGYKVDARHWLALAKAIDEQRLGVLPKDWRGRLKDTLGELDEQVYTAGIETLAESEQEAAANAKSKKAGGTSTPDKPEPKPKSEDEP